MTDLPKIDPLAEPVPLQLRLWATARERRLLGVPKGVGWVSIEQHYSDPDDDDAPACAGERSGHMIGFDLTIAGAAAAHNVTAAVWNASVDDSPHALGSILGVEVWSQTADPGRWIYGAFPRVRPYRAGMWTSPQGEQLLGLTFRYASDGADWGTGPGPVKLGAGGEAAHIEPMATTDMYVTMITTMSPYWALTYTPEGIHR